MYQISLFEYLMVSVAVILSWRVFQAGHPPPAASAAPPAATKTDGVRPGHRGRRAGGRRGGAAG